MKTINAIMTIEGEEIIHKYRIMCVKCAKVVEDNGRVYGMNEKDEIIASVDTTVVDFFYIGEGK